MTDLTQKLRAAFQKFRYGEGLGDYHPELDLLDVAADEIERLKSIIRDADAELYAEKGRYHEESPLGKRMGAALGRVNT